MLTGLTKNTEGGLRFFLAAAVAVPRGLRPPGSGDAPVPELATTGTLRLFPWCCERRFVPVQEQAGYHLFPVAVPVSGRSREEYLFFSRQRFDPLSGRRIWARLFLSSRGVIARRLLEMTEVVMSRGAALETP